MKIKGKDDDGEQVKSMIKRINGLYSIHCSNTVYSDEDTDL